MAALRTRWEQSFNFLYLSDVYHMKPYLASQTLG